MADTAVAPRSDADLAMQAKRNDDLIKQLQIQLNQKQVEIRRQQQESTLRREVDTIDRLTQRKLEAADGAPQRTNRMMISQENLDRVIALENQIKMESQRSEQLKHELQLIDDALRGAEEGIQETAVLIERASQAGPLVALKNQFEERQKKLMSLQQEQETLKASLANRMTTIASLTAELDAKRTIEEDIAQARDMLAGKTREVADKADKLKSLQRIAQRKEKFIKIIQAEDDTKNMKKLEGDKRALHTDLSKQAELHRVNEKAIAANTQRIAHLCGQLDMYAAALEQVFDGKPDRDAHRPTDTAADEQQVAEEDFKLLQNEVLALRRDLAAREAKLEESDAAIEAMEARIEIISVAQKSQSIKVTTELQELERQRALTQDHLARMQASWSTEKARLEQERVELEARASAARH